MNGTLCVVFYGILCKSVIASNQIDRIPGWTSNGGSAAFGMGDKKGLSCCASKLEADFDAQAGPTIVVPRGVHLHWWYGVRTLLKKSPPLSRIEMTE